MISAALPSIVLLPAALFNSKFVLGVSPSITVLIERKIGAVPADLWDCITDFLSSPDRVSLGHRGAIIDEMAISSAVFSHMLFGVGDAPEASHAKDNEALHRFVKVAYWSQISDSNRFAGCPKLMADRYSDHVTDGWWMSRPEHSMFAHIAEHAITNASTTLPYSEYHSHQIGSAGAYLHLPRHKSGLPVIRNGPAREYKVQFDCRTSIILGPGASFSGLLYLFNWRVLAAGTVDTHMAIDIAGTPRVVYDGIVFIIAPDYRLPYWAAHISGDLKTAVISTANEWSLAAALSESSLHNYDVVILSTELVTTPSHPDSLHGGWGALHQVSAGLVVVDDACNYLPTTTQNLQMDRTESMQYNSTRLTRKCRAIAGFTSTADRVLYVHELPQTHHVSSDQLAMMFAMVGRTSMAGKNLCTQRVTNGGQYISLQMDRDSAHGLWRTVSIIKPSYVPQMPEILTTVVNVPVEPYDTTLHQSDYRPHPSHRGRDHKRTHFELVAAASDNPLAADRVSAVDYPASVNVTTTSERIKWSDFTGATAVMYRPRAEITHQVSEVAISPDQTVQHAVMEQLCWPLLVDTNRKVLVVIDPTCHWEWRTLPPQWGRLLKSVTNSKNYKIDMWPKLVNSNLDRCDVRDCDTIVCLSRDHLRVSSLVTKLVSRACQVGENGPAVTVKLYSFVLGPAARAVQ